MSAELCVCGKKKSEHGFTQDVTKTECTWEGDCEEYRPVLDWPDAEGWWWCAGDDFAARLVLAGQDFHNQRYVSMHGGAHTKTQFEAYFGVTARFTRLLEPNPFPSTTK